MSVSPLFIGGLGNRLFQLANAIFVASLTKRSMVYKDLTVSHKRALKQNLSYFKIEDLLENGGHESKYKLEEVFDFEVDSNQADTSEIFYESRNMIQNILANPRENIHIYGYFFNANIVERVIAEGKFPKWSFAPVEIPVTPFVAHIRVAYNKDNFIASTSSIDRLGPILEKSDEWTIFTNDPHKLPLSITSRAKYVYGTEIDVYDTLNIASQAKTLVMTCSTLSAWMAFLGESKEVYCPTEYIDMHGLASTSAKWKLY